MSATKTVEAVESGLALVRELAPLVAAMGGNVGDVANIASGLAGVAQSALNTYTELQGTDLTRLSDATIALQAENDALAAQVAAS